MMGGFAMKLFDISGKKAIVTGASRGLGRGMAEGLHEAGAEVAIIDVLDDVYGTADEIGKAGPKVHAVKGDLGSREQLVSAFNMALEKLGTIDILVNNAGIQKVYKAEEFPMDVWDQVIQINLTTVFQLCQLAGKIMLQKGSGYPKEPIEVNEGWCETIENLELGGRMNKE
jgi:2-dehydro-3-deoxy-D-gluconate 5-dehydrogenase